MPTEILMPALSPTMEEGTLAKWLVKEGDTVNAGDLLAEIETDKATMEFEAVDEGTLGKVLIDEGFEGVKVNTPIAVLLEEGESADDISSDASAPKSADTADPAKDEKQGGEGSGAGKSAEPVAKSETPAPAAPKDDSGERIFASPLARRIAAEKGLDLRQIKGSGPHGRIVRADVEEAKQPATAPAKEAAKPAEKAPAPASGPSSDAVMAMYEGREFEEVKLDGLMKFRGDLNKQLESRGVKLSVNDFIIKACALALQAVPDANAVWAGDKVLKLKPSDVAVAVAIEGGLFTPVLKDAEMKSLSALSAEM